MGGPPEGTIQARAVPLASPGPPSPASWACPAEVVDRADQRQNKTQRDEVVAAVRILPTEVGLRIVRVLVPKLRAVADVNRVQEVVEVRPGHM